MSLTDSWIQVALIYLVLQSPLVAYAAWFAPKLKANRAKWILLTALPWIGVLLGYGLILLAFSRLLDAKEKRNLLLQDQHMERRLGLEASAEVA